MRNCITGSDLNGRRHPLNRQFVVLTQCDPHLFIGVVRVSSGRPIWVWKARTRSTDSCTHDKVSPKILWTETRRKERRTKCGRALCYTSWGSLSRIAFIGWREWPHMGLFSKKRCEEGEPLSCTHSEPPSRLLARQKHYLYYWLPPPSFLYLSNSNQCYAV